MTIGNQLQETTDSIGKIRGQISTTEGLIVTNQQKVQATVEAIEKLVDTLIHDQEVADEAQQNVQDAQRKLDNALADHEKVQTVRDRSTGRVYLCFTYHDVS